MEVTADQHALPDPPPGARSLVVVVLDSLRYDSAAEAGMSNLASIGPLQRRFSYASWTAPSHYNLLMGLMPHTSPTGVLASDYYRQDFLRFRERLGVTGMEFRSFLPSIFLPTVLKRSLGYRTGALVSMPVLNPATAINRDFDVFELMERHNDLGAMITKLRFDGDRPWFWLLNTGETHYPYATADQDPADWPRISGVHGAFAHLDDAIAGVEPRPAAPLHLFDDAALAFLRSRQVEAASRVDELLGSLLQRVPRGTWVVVTSDHGELFGEDGYFGHGPIQHPKVLEVPFAEGLVL